MKFCVVGAGAIGGLMAARLSASGHDVHVVARGETLAAIREGGLTVTFADGSPTIRADVNVAENFDAGLDFDVVILAVKAHQVAGLASQVSALCARDTVVVPVQNGIPWWFFQRFSGPHAGYNLRTLDPDGKIAQAIPAERVVAGIAYPAAERTAANVIHHVEGDRMPVGELDGSKSDRATAIAQAFSSAGFKSRVLTDIRSHLWIKAWGNLAFNPISALTGATLGEICADTNTRGLATSMMREATAIAEALDVRVLLSVEQRINGAEQVGDHKTSMLQDREEGRSMEVGPLIGAFVELGELTGVSTPAIDAVYALINQLNQRLDLERTAQ
ncbi:MAG: 2-dehydropantoate 2-reductase [Actinomycetia bacterium]|nr:2-dehydropantoate 2-reductase [Actinomycetes bacterium]